MAPGQRAAWLVLGNLTVPLDNLDAGWACTSLDLGQPDIREVKDPRPDQHGLIDRTAYLGGRLVSALITAWNGTADMDTNIEQFGAFLDPSARPVLHLTSLSNKVERTLTLRISPYSGGMPMPNPSGRDLQLQWVAADPVLRDVAVKSTTAFTGLPTPGRAYPLTFNRVYPAGGGLVNGIISGAGVMPIRPLLTIYGPITRPQINFFGQVNPYGFQIWFNAGYSIAAGHFVVIDTAAHTCWLDNRTNALGAIDWPNTVWPVLPNLPDTTAMTLAGDAAGLTTSGVTQVQATWQDGYLS
jgi:hypothetical protein